MTAARSTLTGRGGGLPPAPASASTSVTTGISPAEATAAPTVSARSSSQRTTLASESASTCPSFSRLIVGLSGEKAAPARRTP